MASLKTPCRDVTSINWSRLLSRLQAREKTYEQQEDNGDIDQARETTRVEIAIWRTTPHTPQTWQLVWLHYPLLTDPRISMRTWQTTAWQRSCRSSMVSMEGSQGVPHTSYEPTKRRTSRGDAQDILRKREVRTRR